MLKAVAIEGLVAFAVARYLPQAVPAFTLFSTTALFFLTFGIQTSLHFIYAVFIYPYHISPLRNIPGPPGGSLILGHGAKEIGKSAGVIHSDWLKTIENPNPNFMRYMGFFGQEKIVPLSAEAYRAILTDKSFEMPGWFREGAKTLLGDGLVLAEGSSHTFQRKRIAPAFSQRQIRSIIPAFWKNCQVMNELLRDVVKNDKDHSKETTTINMLDWTNRVTFDMIGDTTFGANFEGLKNPGGFYEVFNRNYPQEGFTNPLDAICMNVLPIFVPHDLLNYLPLPRYQAQLRDREIIRSECKKLIDKIDVSKLDQAEGAEQANLLTVIVNNGEMDLNLMLENMMTFIAAGFGTNAASLLWGLHALATHPEIQTRLRKEIRDTLKTSDAELNSTIMDSMKYLHWVVMENARLYPSIPGNWRTAMKEVNVLGQTFPKGTELIISAYIANRNKASWGPDAEEFNPERWSDANRKVGVEHDGQFMTYSLGHKACIGKEYSVRAIKAVFIALIGTFEFEFKGKKKMGLNDLVPGLTMRPLNGLDCEIKLASPW